MSFLFAKFNPSRVTDNSKYHDADKWMGFEFGFEPSSGAKRNYKYYEISKQWAAERANQRKAVPPYWIIETQDLLFVPKPIRPRKP